MIFNTLYLDINKYCNLSIMAKYVTRVDPFTGEILSTKIHKTIAVNNQEDFVMTFVGLTTKLSEASVKLCSITCWRSSRR